MLTQICTLLVPLALAQGMAVPAAPEADPVSRWIDVDVDGRDDLVLQLPGRGLKLFLHLADGRFEDVTERAGSALLADTRQASWSDVDQDGDPDLLALTRSGALALLCNEGDGSFRRVEAGSGLEEEHAVSSSWHDFDRDGLPDLLLQTADDVELWRNEGDCRFVSMLAARETEQPPGPTTPAGPLTSGGVPNRPVVAEGGFRATPGATGTPLSDAPVSSLVGSAVEQSRGAMRPDAVDRASPAFGPGFPDVPDISGIQSTPTCAQSLEDQSSSTCLQADSTPTLGRLVPLGPYFNIDAATGNVGMGTLAPGYALEVAGQILSGTGNSAGGAESAVGGGKLNAASGAQATIAGGESNLATGVGATVGGGLFNLAVSDQATIGGGVDNSAGYRAFVGGGQTNDADFAHATVTGGKENEAGAAYAVVGGGTLNLASGSAATVAGGEGNQASGGHATIAGGWNNSAVGEAFVGGGRDHSASGAASVVAGGQGNAASGASSSIAGGDVNVASGTWSSVSGGVGNEATGSASSVGGGNGNQATGNQATVPGGAENVAQGLRSFVGGGLGNVANSEEALVAGGNSNATYQPRSAIGGGESNLILAPSSRGIPPDPSHSVISGGSSNTIQDGFAATISGGYENIASGDSATVGGGERNEAITKATVGGGIDNEASGGGATIGGGRSNVASGGHATIPGGWNNEAAGAASFAAGTRAEALHDGSFVWSDGSAGNLESTAARQFLIYASGGVGIGTTTPSSALEVEGSIRASGNDASLLCYNPNDVGAQAKLDWLNDVARIRVGGSGTGAQNGLDIQTTGDTSLMRIKHDGKVGIGTSAPSEDLHVVGDARIGTQGGGDGTSERLAIDGLFGTWNVGTLNSGAGNFYIHPSETTAADFQITPDGKVSIMAGATPGFDLAVNGTAAKSGGGSWSVLSDRRLKKNVADLDQALATLLALRGVTYEYKDPEALGELAGTRTGFIAQEVEAVLPDWVDEREDGTKYLSIRGFEALVVEALRELQQEAQDENRELRERVARLERERPVSATALGMTPCSCAAAASAATQPETDSGHGDQ